MISVWPGGDGGFVGDDGEEVVEGEQAGGFYFAEGWEREGGGGSCDSPGDFHLQRQYLALRCASRHWRGGGAPLQKQLNTPMGSIEVGG